MDKKDILNSWKEISQYLEHNARTCYRWERNLGLPIHRYDNDSSRSTVFAYKSELDEWVNRRESDIDNIEPKKLFFKTKGLTFSLIIFIASLITVVSFLYIGPLNRSFPSKKEIISIGIQPFEYGGSSEFDEYLARGITEEIKNYLSLSEDLKIITIAPTQEPIDEKTLKNRIKVDYILEGRVQREKNEIKLRYELISAKNNAPILEKDVLEQFENIQQMNDDVCKQILAKLGIGYNGPISNPVVSPFRNNEAFDIYLKGKYILNHIKNKEPNPWNLYHKGKYYYGSYTRKSNEIAIALFNAAIEIDEGFVEAYIGLAQCYLNYVNLGWDNNIKWPNKAEALLAKAKSISQNCPEYYSSMTKLHLIKYLAFNEETKVKALEIAKIGLEKFPNNYNLNIITSYILFLEFAEEGNNSSLENALGFAEKSFWQNPFTVDNLFYTELLLLSKQFENGLEICSFVNKIDSSLMSDFRMGELHYFSGNTENSKAIFNRIEAPLSLKIGALFYLGMIAAQYNKKEEVQSIIEQLENLSMDLFEDEMRYSSMYFGIGDEKKGFEHLDRFFQRSLSKKMKFKYERYIALDRNFDTNNQTIRRRYFE